MSRSRCSSASSPVRIPRSTSPRRFSSTGRARTRAENNGGTLKKKWVLNPRPAAASKAAADLGIHPEIASILIRRGVTEPDAMARFLDPSPETLESPFVFRDMRKAVDRIRLAVSRGEKILVYGDYDVDGVTGTAILYPVLKRLGADVSAHIPHRVNEGYGLNRDSLEARLKEGFGLVVTVDNGITGKSQIEYLVSRGVDAILVDHHLPKDGLPPAHAIVSSVVGPGDGNLAACGLAFKLGWALLGSYKEVEEYLDLVAVGTVADLAGVLGENRILLKQGLALLARTRRPGLRALLEVAGVSRRAPSYRDIAFGLGPRINAAGRMGSPLAAFELLTTTDPAEARRLARLLDDGNRDRQRVEAEAYRQAHERLDAESELDRVLVVESDGWHEGVLGIVAARLVERYHRPSIVIALKEGMGKGSGRSVASFSLFDSVLQCEDLLVTFGGHAQACGLTIRRENVGAFREKLNAVAAQARQLSGTSELLIEGELSPTELDLKFLRDLERLAPFGPGHQKPFFRSKGMRVKGDVRKRGKDTLSCWMTDASGKMTCEVVGFRLHERWQTEERKAAYDIVYQPSLAEFNGIVSIQLELEDWA
ncbi:MAG TPA: single-stranded-DNA-specific exonuclease RecJ [Candidatus Eisenbacteria bacterium]|nr:single-stranded-DNA-specific exonuclease RecJ [Candidatus Eisenbacteria bacterium]